MNASGWLRGVLSKDKDWPLRPLKTNRGSGTACYNTTVTDRMPLTLRRWIYSKQSVLNPNEFSDVQPSLYELFPESARTPWPVLKRRKKRNKRCQKSKQQSEKIKQMKRRRKALLFPRLLNYDTICSKKNVLPPYSCATHWS